MKMSLVSRVKGIGAAATGLVLIASNAYATMGGEHICTDALASYSVDFEKGDGLLHGLQSQSNEGVKFKQLSRIVIEQREGFCESRQCHKRFEFHVNRYLLKVSFEEFGRSRDADLYCEDFWDSSPAGCDCANEVVTKHRVIAPSYRDLR